jgi:hypothetical protein
MGRLQASSLGLKSLRMALYDGVIASDSPELFDAKVRAHVAPAVVSGLCVAAEADCAPASVNGSSTLHGGFDYIQEEFHRRMWTDGLPVVPPTRERVEAHLTYSPLARTDVIGVYPPANREATVESVAVNAVMAGCRPEYFPVALAIAQCLADPAFRLEDAGATPGWETMTVISGPIAKELDFNSGPGVLRVGRRANTSIGRFVRLIMGNVAGLHIAPGVTDQAAIGQSFLVALAEDDDVISDIGWDPYRVDRGFNVSDSVVTLQSVVAISAPIYSAGADGRKHLDTLSRLLSDAMGPWSSTGVAYEAWHPLLVLAPGVARILVNSGISKQDVREYIFEHSTIEASWMEDYAHQIGLSEFNLAAYVANGTMPARYAESSDPHRQVPMMLRPEWLGIVVAGSPARNQSRAYVNNHNQGVPVSRVIVRPS